MKTKILLSVNVILIGIIVFMGACMYGENKELNATQNNTAENEYACLDNPIDPLFAKALCDSESMAEYRQIQELYFDTWKTQYETIMKKIRKKCKFAEDIADYNLFVKEMDESFGKLQPLIIDEMLDSYNMPESPEKHSWGNGTSHTLLMYQGTMYRNACMFLISSYAENEYNTMQRAAANKLKDVKKNIAANP